MTITQSRPSALRVRVLMCWAVSIPARRLKPFAWPLLFIYLAKHMLYGVYKERGICFRNHCGAEPPRDTGPPGLLPAVGGRDPAPASYKAADRGQAPARAT